jgi:hypothetical protein
MYLCQSYVSGERIAVEYLLAQSGKGDLLKPNQDSEIGVTLPAIVLEEKDEEFLDATVCDAADVNMEIPRESQQVGSQKAAKETNPTYMSKCDQCGVEMNTGELAVHMVSHFGDTDFGCGVCDNYFTSESLLQEHMQIHTINIGVGPNSLPLGTGPPLTENWPPTSQPWDVHRDVTSGSNILDSSAETEDSPVPSQHISLDAAVSPSPSLATHMETEDRPPSSDPRSHSTSPPSEVGSQSGIGARSVYGLVF